MDVSSVIARLIAAEQALSSAVPVLSKTYADFEVVLADAQVSLNSLRTAVQAAIAVIAPQTSATIVAEVAHTDGGTVVHFRAGVLPQTTASIEPEPINVGSGSTSSVSEKESSSLPDDTEPSNSL